jgi:hypothetical protein
MSVRIYAASGAASLNPNPALKGPQDVASGNARRVGMYRPSPTLKGLHPPRWALSGCDPFRVGLSLRPRSVGVAHGYAIHPLRGWGIPECGTRMQQLLRTRRSREFAPPNAPMSGSPEIRCRLP